MEKRFIFLLQNSKTIINAKMMENVACCHVDTSVTSLHTKRAFLRVKDVGGCCSSRFRTHTVLIKVTCFYFIILKICVLNCRCRLNPYDTITRLVCKNITAFSLERLNRLFIRHAMKSDVSTSRLLKSSHHIKK